jgi:hypothetical protein
MKTALDCIPCLIRQALDAARAASPDPTVWERMVKDCMRLIDAMDLDQSPPVVAQRIHRRVRELLGVEDPYREAKQRQNRMALAMLPELKTRVDSAADPWLMAMRLAIAGNVIDTGVQGDVSSDDVRQSIHQALRETFIGDAETLRQAAKKARRILYLADNAGEVVFDRLLIERLSPMRVTVAVRGAPVINDATLADARAAGLHKIVEVIDNGSDAPGTLLDDCSPEFCRRFDEADLILAKGQGNYETLCDHTHNVFFLFQAKCLVIADRLQTPLGTHMVAAARDGAATMEGASHAGL